LSQDHEFDKRSHAEAGGSLQFIVVWKRIHAGHIHMTPVNIANELLEEFGGYRSAPARPGVLDIGHAALDFATIIVVQR